MITKSLLFISLLLGLAVGRALAQSTAADAGNGNPILPGWLADPTIVKFVTIYYLYAIPC